MVVKSQMDSHYRKYRDSHRHRVRATSLGTSYISSGDDKFLALTYTPKPGETEKQYSIMLKKLKNIWIVKIRFKLCNILLEADTTRSNRKYNSLAIMVKYKSDTNFDEEPDKVLKHIYQFKQPGEWKNQDLGTGAGNDSVEVTVKGPSTDDIKGTVEKVEKTMKDIDGIANVKSDLTQTYDQYEIKVDQNKAR